jgi:hypothetical protein
MLNIVPFASTAIFAQATSLIMIIDKLAVRDQLGVMKKISNTENVNHGTR